MKPLTHGYHKGECDPKEGQQLTLCGQPIHKINRYTIQILGEQAHGWNKVTCSHCLAKLIKPQQRPALIATYK